MLKSLSMICATFKFRNIQETMFLFIRRQAPAAPITTNQEKIMSMLTMFTSQAHALINQNGQTFYAPNTDSTFKAIVTGATETELHVQCCDSSHPVLGGVVITPSGDNYLVYCEGQTDLGLFTISGQLCQFATISRNLDTEKDSFGRTTQELQPILDHVPVILKQSGTNLLLPREVRTKQGDLITLASGDTFEVQAVPFCSQMDLRTIVVVRQESFLEY